MATIRDVVTYALKQAKVIAPGDDPTSEEAEDGLTAFQSMIDLWVAGGMFGTLEDVYLEEDDTAEEGKRYFVPTGLTLTDATSVYEDAQGNTRQPRDLSLYETLTEAGTRSVKLYDRTAWVELTGLTLDSTAPLAERGIAGLSACLAQTYCEMFGGELGAYTQRLASEFQGAISGKHGSTRDKIAPEYF